jgi:uncharacterized protein (TIGR03435 family)
MSDTLRALGRVTPVLWLVVLIVPAFVLVSRAQTPDLKFEVASIRPNTGSDVSVPDLPNPPDGIRLANEPLESVIRYAYGVQPFRLVGAPRWTHEERFDIQAKASRSITDDERRQMLRSLLVERFQLKAHFESREQTVYLMTPARADRQTGPGLKPRPDCLTAKCESGGTTNPARGAIRMRALTLARLADSPLSSVLNQVVRDGTGIPGTFDVELSWLPDTARAGPGDNRPSFFTAVEEQLAMKLTPQRGPVDVLVIEGISRPTPN